MEDRYKIFNIDGKTIILTGATGVIGSEVAKYLATFNVNLVLVGRNFDKLKSLKKEISNKKSNIEILKCDLLKEKSLQNVIEKIIKKFNSINALINAAGGHVPGSVLSENQTIFQLDFKKFDETIRLNLDGTVLPSIIFGEEICKNNNGSIITISSMAATRAITRVVGYSIAKAGIENFTRWLAMDLALKFGNGIRVNSIAPGFLITNQNKNLLIDRYGNLTERGEKIISMTPFKRFGEPKELLGAILFLLFAIIIIYFYDKRFKLNRSNFPQVIEVIK